MAVKDAVLERRTCPLPDYQPAVDYGAWRVAVLNSCPQYGGPDRLTVWQRHSQTDEVFVLLRGRCLLLLAGNGDEPEAPWGEELVPGQVYNVKRNAWHTHLLADDTSVLIVENRDTSPDNSPACPITGEQRREIERRWNMKGETINETEDL